MFCTWSATYQAGKRCVNEQCPRCITEDDRAGADRAKLPFSLASYRASKCGYRTQEKQDG